MASWSAALSHIANNVEEHFDELKYKLIYRLGGLDPVKIVAYNGFGRPDKLYLKGRVLEDKGEKTADDNDRLWDNLVNMYRRMESDEVPHARLKVRFQETEQEVEADNEGYFEAWIYPNRALTRETIWQEVSIELLNPIPPGQPLPIFTTGKVFVPPPTARFAVISDIDDTVVKSDAAHLMKMARNVFLSNARTRLPFPGVAAFYRALLDGPHGNDLNPLFFVSSSPWNLYDLLVDFFHLQNIPLGPVLFLRDWGLTENEFLPIHNLEYKMGTIRRLMDFYPELPFILIGDSGQEDPEIYAQVVSAYPGRVQAIYIRNVSADLKRPEAIRELAAKVAQAGSTLILADDTLSIARHAVQQGWISEQTLQTIAFEKEKDEAPPSPIEKLLGDEKTEGPTVTVSASSQDGDANGTTVKAVEQALQSGAAEKQKPPTVIVEPDGEQNTGQQNQTSDQKREGAEG